MISKIIFSILLLVFSTTVTGDFCMAAIKLWAEMNKISGKPVESFPGWNELPSVPALIFKTLNNYDQFVSSLSSCNVDGKQYTVAGLEDMTVRLWDLETRQAVKLLDGHKSPVTGLCCMQSDIFGENEMLIIGGGGSWTIGDRKPDPSIRVWSLKDGCKAVLQGHTQDVNAICSLDSNVIASCSYDGTIRLWRLDQSRCMRIFAQKNKRFISIAQLDNTRLACGYVTDQNFVAYFDILNLESGEVEHTFNFNQGSPLFLPIAGTQKLLLFGTFDSKCTAVNWQTGKQEYSFDLPKGNFWGMTQYKKNNIAFFGPVGGVWICNDTGYQGNEINLGISGSYFFLPIGDQFVYANSEIGASTPLFCIAKNPLL